MAAPEKRRGRSILVILGVAIAGLTVVFGVTSTRSSRQFAEYRQQTLESKEAPPPWMEGEVDVADCISFAIEWATDCPGIQSWCEAEVPRVIQTCMRSSDRSGYCAEVGNAILTTGFGYQDCEQRRAAIDEKYAKRWHKKYCAKSYRSIADHCRQLDSE